MPSRWKRRVALSLVAGTALLVGAADIRLVAQGTIGTILGTVTDSSGSVIPGVTVTVRNTGTAAAQPTVTDSEGRYTIPALPVGDYEVQAELQGFQTVIRRGIRLSVGADNTEEEIKKAVEIIAGAVAEIRKKSHTPHVTVQACSETVKTD